MWSKYRMVVGVSAVVGAGLGLVRMNREAALAQAIPTPQQPPIIRPPVNCPYNSWDDNWDRRATLKRSKRNDNGDKNQIDEKAKTARVSRHLIFIRHGQYNLSGKTDAERTLTPTGQQQAEYVGNRLKSMNLKYNLMINSTMARAKETSDIIASVLGDDVAERKEQRMLEEGAPIVPDPRPSGFSKNEYHFYRDGARIEAAFRDLFYRPDVDQKEDSYEIVVCHANVIRYFVCRALQFPPEAWLRFSLKHCSITWFTIHGNGNVSVRSVGDSGFLPAQRLTS